MSWIEDIKELQALRDQGALSEDEFEAAKSKILADNGVESGPKADQSKGQTTKDKASPDKSTPKKKPLERWRGLSRWAKIGVVILVLVALRFYYWQDSKQFIGRYSGVCVNPGGKLEFTIDVIDGETPFFSLAPSRLEKGISKQTLQFNGEKLNIEFDQVDTGSAKSRKKRVNPNLGVTVNKEDFYVTLNELSWDIDQKKKVLEKWKDQCRLEASRSEKEKIKKFDDYAYKCKSLGAWDANKKRTYFRVSSDTCHFMGANWTLKSFDRP